jgi:hypothetical protein
MEVQVNNITFQFRNQGSDLMRDEENLGLGHLLIPGPMGRRFLKECGWDNRVLPHYDSDDMDRLHIGSAHECYNTDTQIVLMNWLFDKRRKYKLEFYGLDPYWLFHDSMHAVRDVHCYEVSGITSWAERERLLEGAEFAARNAVYITADSVIKIAQAWSRRWKFWEGTNSAPFKMADMFPFMAPAERDIAEYWDACGDIDAYKTNQHERSYAY